jgi:uncharacterized protein YciI
VGRYVLIGRDGARGIELRKQHRTAHLANLRPLAEQGRVVYAGPLLDDGGAPCGSVVVFDAESLDAARRFAAGDPYVVHGIFERWEVLASMQVFPEPAKS